MQNLSLQTICKGILCVRDNASELLEDARILRQSGRISRAYTLAYFACEEAGKVSILVGVATKLAVSLPVDWKVVRKRFNSHDSKASQFMGLGSSIQIILEAVAAGRKTVDIDQLMHKAAIGVVFGPELFATRNASVYCDFKGDSFTSPNEQIRESMADEMIEYATKHVNAATMVFGKSVDEAIATITAGACRERHDERMSLVKETAEIVHSALQNK
jgi:AbiV family abortive infection protein